jgi:5-methylcytosine-specific restriction protein A
MSKSKYIDLSTVEGRQQFYKTKEWNSIRLIVLANNPYCEECLKLGVKTIATDVDHIIDIKDAPERFMDMANLQGLCRPCHSTKTMKSQMHITVNAKFTSSQRKWGYIK